MDRRTDNELWSIPGGGVGIGETIAETVVREVEEETSLECVVPPTITKQPQKPLSVRSGLLHTPAHTRSLSSCVPNVPGAALLACEDFLYRMDFLYRIKRLTLLT